MFTGRAEIHPGSDVNKVKLPVSGRLASVKSRVGDAVQLKVHTYKEHRLAGNAMGLCRVGRGEEEVCISHLSRVSRRCILCSSFHIGHKFGIAQARAVKKYLHS